MASCLLYSEIFAIVLLNLYHLRKDKCPKLISKLLLIFEKCRNYFGKQKLVVEKLNTVMLSEI